MLLAKANQGDTFRHEGTIYMAMIRVRGAWGCRPFLGLSKGYGEPVFFEDNTEIGEFVERYQGSVKGKRNRGKGAEVHQLGDAKKKGVLL